MTSTIRMPEPGEAGAIRRMWEEAFPEGGLRFTDWYFSRVYKRDFTLGLFMGAELVSNLQMIPYTLCIRGSHIPVETLSGVATGAAHRNRGHAKALMAEALRHMARRGLGFTFLYPFNHLFYEKLGWQTCSAALEHFRPCAELPDAPPTGWRAQRADLPDIGVLSSLYDRYMAGRNCRCVRGAAQWNRRIEETGANGGFILMAYYGGEPAAYALCEEQAEEIAIVEMAHTSTRAVAAMLAALKPLGKAVGWTAPQDDRAFVLSFNWKDRVKLQPHVMFRVTDVPLAFWQAAPACDGELAVAITGDNMAPENNGTYLVKAVNGAAQAVKTDAMPQFTCGIGALAGILTGFYDAGEAMNAGLAEGEPAGVGLLNAMYPRQSNFLFELY